MFRIRLQFASLASLASNWCLCNQPQNNTRCTFFRSVNSYTDALVSGFDTDPHEHIRHTCWYTTTCIVYIYVKYRIEIMRYIAWSVLRYPENILDIDTDLCRKYRMSMSRILDTIPNTSRASCPDLDISVSVQLRSTTYVKTWGFLAICSLDSCQPSKFSSHHRPGARYRSAR